MSKDFKIISIGAGNLSNHLIPSLFNAGCEISQVYSRKYKNARSLARKVNAKAIDNLTKIDTSADFYLIMVHDDAIADVVAALPKLGPKQFLAHTSGATPTNLLIKKAENYGSFYPLQSFKKGKQSAMRKVPFLIYGSNAKTLRKYRMLARQLSPSVKEANDKERLQYHLSAVLINNFTNHLACLTEQFLLDNKLDPKVLSAIKEYTFDIITKGSACALQTGPAQRNDEKVIRKHLKLIKDEKMLKEVYKVMTKSIQSISESKE